MTLPDATYARLLALRTGLRHFERWSEQQARAAGLTPAQHQLLLAVRGHGDPRGPTVGEVADYLLLRHHSAVGLIDRADAAGLVRRQRDADDHRVVRLRLTETGAERLEALSALHVEELERLAPDLPSIWQGLAPVQRTHGFTTPEPRRSGATSSKAPVRVCRAGDQLDVPGRRVLVDRLWPRGVPRGTAAWDVWAREVAPSPALRKWYGHEPERFEEFARRYRAELGRSPARDAFAELHRAAAAGDLVLVTATEDVAHSGAAVLQELLAAR